MWYNSIKEMEEALGEEGMMKLLHKRGYSENQSVRQNLAVLNKNIIEDGMVINRCFAKLNEFLELSGSGLKLAPRM